MFHPQGAHDGRCAVAVVAETACQQGPRREGCVQRARAPATAVGRPINMANVCINIDIHITIATS